MPKNILFICGSLNQTTMMHRISQSLVDEFDCYFTPFYGDGLIDLATRVGLMNFTILGGRHRRETDHYLSENHLQVDWRGQGHAYDLVITCSDLIVPKNILRKRLVLVQEGMTEPENLLYWLVKWLKFPRYLANTAATGLSNAYDVFCVASHGYRELFIRKGVRPAKIVVTGIPNFDHFQAMPVSDFPLQGFPARDFPARDFPPQDFVLVATSALRECFQPDDRKAFIQKCVRIAGGRSLIFKLHPLENVRRARWEIEQYAPGASVLTEGNINGMIATCQVLITQHSTCTFVGLALGKEVYSELDINDLRQLMPIQNNGSSARRIGNICRRVLNTPMSELGRVRAGFRSRPRWGQADGF
jgi:hypothetical protein